MGDKRKLQGEIDRCLKKVVEGVETFDDIFQKFHSAPNANQKDKYEQELKKEIKKLQRLRDQIKTWMSSTEIKDKKQLQEARKNIEQQMEKFKAVERETKTKAYSKEGLGAGHKLDPQEKEKEECTHWIREALQELQIQIDKFEADIDILSASLKKKKSDRDKLERVEETKQSIERHKYHIETLEKILRAIDNDVVDLKPIHNLRSDVDYYISSNQDSDFKENDLMYEEIDLDNLSSLLTPVITPPVNQSHSSSLSNGASSSLGSSVSTLMDISGTTLNLHTHLLTNHSLERPLISTSSSNHGDNESTIDLTTPSSTQPSSPSASPALSATDDRKRNKSESEDSQSNRNRSNSGANGSSTSSISHITSPKNPLLYQQSSGVSLSSKTPVSSSSTGLSTSVPPHFTYPTSTQPVLQYSTIVSQSTLQSSASSSTTTTTNGNSFSRQSSVIPPPTKQMSRQTSVNNHESTMHTPLTQPTTTTTSSATTIPTLSTSNSTSNSSHSSALLTNNDRTGVLNQQILNNISQLSGASNPSSTITLANGTTISTTSYSGPGSGLSNSNIPLEFSPTTPLDPPLNSQPSPLLSRTISETDRPINSSTSLMTNGSLDGHSSFDSNTLPNLPISTTTTGISTSSFLSNDLPLNNTSGIIGQFPDHHTLRYLSTSNNQPTIQTNRVPLTQAETRMLNRLNSAFAKLPSLLESERQRTSANRIYGRNPLGNSQLTSSYPQTPPTGNDTPEFYYRLAPETLFFVFYYMEGTRAQYLAAKALKRQSWRFHTKYMMWFQRHEEPKKITDDYEQGTYILFDYERWQTRKRDNFLFEYKYLEDREF